MSESQNKAAAAYWATMTSLILVLLWFVIGGQQFGAIVLPALSVAFAGFCIWFTVRIINRRERRTKRTVVALVTSLLLAYPLSFVVAATILIYMEAPPSGIAKELLSGIYSPLIWIVDENRNEG
jgi:O-antigen/teichoic acid export membrane protein